MKRVALHTLGCKLNYTETATLGRQFAQRGFTVGTLDEQAEVVVINTCTVTERADRECRQLVRRALRHSPKAYVVVMGCYAQLRPDAIAAIEGVDLILGTSEKLDLFRHAGGFTKRDSPEIRVGALGSSPAFGHATSAGFEDRTRAFLKIQDGCDYGCTFYTIPRARGESRSVPANQLVETARDIVLQGYREIVLSGVNVGDYGRKHGQSLHDLVRELEGVEGLERLRISSIEPNLLSDELLKLWFDSRILCHHFHLPLQSGSDHVLALMRRRYTTSWYRNRVEAITKHIPHAGIGADVIVGFPGETDALFEETYRFLVEVPLSYLHVFTYSERPDTLAVSLQGTVDPRIRSQRSDRLRNLSVRKRSSFISSFVGKEVRVLFEGKTPEGKNTGLSDEYIRVEVESREDLSNVLLPVRIEGSRGEVALGIVHHQAAEMTQFRNPVQWEAS